MLFLIFGFYMNNKIIDTVCDWVGREFVDPPKSIQQVVDLLKSKDDKIYVDEKNKRWTGFKLAREIKSLSESDSKKLLAKIDREVANRRNDEEISNIILSKVKSKYPEERVEILEFVGLGRNNYGLDAVICDHRYMLNFRGNTNELIKEINSIINKHVNDKAKCPFCAAVKPRHRWEERCECGAFILYEVVKPNSLLFTTTLAEAVPAGKSVSGFRMWFLDEESAEKFVELENMTEEEINNFFRAAIEDAEYVPLGEVKVGLPKEITDKIIDAVCTEFGLWVIGGGVYEHVEGDEPWDNSGALEEHRSNKFFRIVLHKTLGEWMATHSGERVATHSPGRGWYYPDYEEEVRDVVWDSLSNYYEKTHGKDFHEKENMLDEIDDIEEKIINAVANMSVYEAWKRGGIRACHISEKIEFDVQQEEEYFDRLDKLSEQVVEEYFLKFITKRIEKNNSKEFFAALGKVLPELSPEEAESLLVAGFDMSNSVRVNFERIISEYRKSCQG